MSPSDALCFAGEPSHDTGDGTAAKNEPEKVDSGEKWLVKRSPKPGRGKNPLPESNPRTQKVLLAYLTAEQLSFTDGIVLYIYLGFFLFLTEGYVCGGRGLFVVYVLGTWRASPPAFGLGRFGL